MPKTFAEAFREMEAALTDKAGAGFFSLSVDVNYNNGEITERWRAYVDRTKAVSLGYKANTENVSASGATADEAVSGLMMQIMDTYDEMSALREVVNPEDVEVLIL